MSAGGGGGGCLRGTQEGNEKVKRAEHASCTLKRDGFKGENRGYGVALGIPAGSGGPNLSAQLGIRSIF